MFIIGGGRSVEHEQTTQKGQGHRDSEESCKHTPNPGTQKISKKASGPRHALMTQKTMDGWITHKTVSTKAKADMSL